MLQPIGPVAVFGASNFPLAFSVAGGDTASALAARNPVIVKAHPAHPATSELVGGAIARVVAKLALPSGTFSLVHGFSPEVSVALVTHEHVKAVAFTGSLRAGRALFDAAAKRREPIPVFSEMGSVNPVFLLKSALDKNAEGTAAGFFKSVTLGVGQFCTCPGLAFGLSGEGAKGFVDHLGKQFEAGAPGTMLTTGIAKAYVESFEKAAKIPGVETRVSGQEPDGQRSEGRPGFFVTDAKTWLQHKELREEMFGPSTVVVGCASEAEMLECARSLEGSLTATIHGDAGELAQQQELLGILQRKAGRLLFNGYPTGVEVGYAMQHGGPYPASTDSRFTSVGTAAIYRFARPVCYQNFPDEALPQELRNTNPRGIWRMIGGRLTKDPLG
jgi:alpha-ketoglutaric semialdehyde dehydrogenase